VLVLALEVSLEILLFSAAVVRVHALSASQVAKQTIHTGMACRRSRLHQPGSREMRNEQVCVFMAAGGSMFSFSVRLSIPIRHERRHGHWEEALSLIPGIDRSRILLDMIWKVMRVRRTSCMR
jgi:hypothetical protein